MILGMPAKRIASAAALGDYRTQLYTGDGSFPRTLSTIDLSAGGVFIYHPRGTFQECRMFFKSGSGVFNKLLTPNNSSAVSVASDFVAGGFTIDSASPSSLANQSGWDYVAQFFSAAPDTCSIVQYTGNGTARDIAHGLTSTPEMVLVVPDAFFPGAFFLTKSNPGISLSLAQRTAPGTLDFWDNTSPSSTSVRIGTSFTNMPSATYTLISFGGSVCQQRIYAGNGSTTGPVVDFGFQPEAVWIKRFTGGGRSDWFIIDQLRSPGFSGTDLRKTLSTLAPETTANTITLATNGIQLNTTDNQFNGTGFEYIAVGFRPRP